MGEKYCGKTVSFWLAVRHSANVYNNKTFILSILVLLALTQCAQFIERLNGWWLEYSPCEFIVNKFMTWISNSGRGDFFHMRRTRASCEAGEQILLPSSFFCYQMFDIYGRWKLSNTFRRDCLCDWLNRGPSTRRSTMTVYYRNIR